MISFNAAVRQPGTLTFVCGGMFSAVALPVDAACVWGAKECVHIIMWGLIYSNYDYLGYMQT